MARRRSVVAGLMLLACVAVWGCDQLAALQNNKVRIAGDWHPYRYSMKEDATYDFAEGIIKRDDFGWGTYKFIKNSVIEVDVNGQVSTYNLDFPDDETMVWYSDGPNGKRIIHYEWKR